MASQILKYGCRWQATMHPLAIEMECIRLGGQWQNPKNGKTCGAGMFNHYLEGQKLAFPGKAWHRWNMLALEQFLEHQYIGEMGCVHGSTRIWNPITGEEPSIEWLFQNGIAPTVMTLNGPREASVPFIRGVDDLYRVTMASGSSFIATLKHEVMKEDGSFEFVGNLGDGDWLLGVAPSPPDSISKTPDEIRNIKFIERDVFYDLSVEEQHHYFAEGCIHHNCAAAGKSDSAASDLLFDWYCFANCTTVLVSSTDLSSLDLRVWGMIKAYHRAAKNKLPWLPGHLIEGARRIIYDSKDEASEGRDFKNGILAVPVKRGNTYIGLGCFPAGTLVDTPKGQVPIEAIAVGQEVITAVGARRVRGTSCRIRNTLVRVRLADGRRFDCTPSHRVFTNQGWIKACDLGPYHYILSPDETMRLLSDVVFAEVSREPILQPQMQTDGESENLCFLHQNFHPWGCQKHILQQILFSELEGQRSDYFTQAGRWKGLETYRAKIESVAPGTSGTIQSHCRQTRSRFEGTPFQGDTTVLDQAPHDETESIWESRQWASADGARISASGTISGCCVQLFDCDRHLFQGKRRMASLQTGSGLAGYEVVSRDRWRGARAPETNTQGPAQGFENEGAWVDGVEILELGSDERYSESQGGYPVYNLEVEGHPSYSVCGLIVHNSLVGIHNKRVRLLGDEMNLMPRTFLDSISNLAKCPDFKLRGLGNPNETTNAHGFLCEPAEDLGGWDSGIDQQPGTKTWRTRMPNGVAIQYPGSDSPNMDAPIDQPPPFPFLITRKQMEDDAKIWMANDWHYLMFNEGRMPRGQGSKRVITRSECVKFGAMKPPKWRDTNQTRIGFLDAAYRGLGGDRCVFGELQFGLEAESEMFEQTEDGIINQMTFNADKRMILSLIDTMVIPIKAEKDDDLPEDQIVEFVKHQCTNRGIPPENFFYDAAMRTSLVQAFARNWSTATESIDFGGKPSNLSVSAEIDIPCHDYFSKRVTELWYLVRLVISSGQFRGMTQDMLVDGCTREFKTVAGGKIEVESKVEMKQKTGMSPDLFDALAAGVWGARRRGFVIRRAKPINASVRTSAWKTDARRRSEMFWKSGSLIHA